MFAEIIFYLPFRRTFTYHIPDDLIHAIAFGKRVLAPFGKRVLTGFCMLVKEDAGEIEISKIKDIFEVVDESPVIDRKDLELYQWMADYYLCGVGEVLRLCTPYGTDMQSARYLISDPQVSRDALSALKRKNTILAKILQVLIEHPKIPLTRLQKAIKKKNIYSIIRKLQLTGIITIDNRLPEARVREKKERFVKLTAPIESIYELIPVIEHRSPKQALLLLTMTEYARKDVSVKTLLSKTGLKSGVLLPLVKKGLISVFFKKVQRKHRETLANDLPDYQLTAMQKDVYEIVNKSIQEQQFQVFLLHGVTGSGKTLIYLDLAKQALALGKSVLILVPEISLTPQITSRFIAKFGSQVVVIHSQISPGERFDTWKMIREGKVRVVIGARSALFAPLQNIGLIVIDEEHDASFKQTDTTPKYHARDTGIMRAKLAGCPVVLGSATPSIESMHNAETGKYTLLKLTERADDAVLPEIRLVNVVEEKKQKFMSNVFSQTLLDKINDRLVKKEGVIILQNRRGFSTQVYCFDCGEMEMCENCSVALVHHINSNIIECHYCGYRKIVPEQCTKCGSPSIRFFGMGTERVEDELSYYFPNARMQRVDSDAIAKKGSLSRILGDFRSGQTDILIGTQMVAKGLDFSRVTLVGVISAETNLWLPDFRADERTFQLLTQVAGRAGRSIHKGEVLIQTQNDRHPVLTKVVLHDYDNFYKAELQKRRNLHYPPFSRLCLIEVKDKSEKNAQLAISDFYNFLQPAKKILRISPPCTAVISRIRGEYRYQILVKSDRITDPTGSILRKIIWEAFVEFKNRSEFNNVPLSFDVDPQHVM
ncbi:MAG: primosomal protein N' [Ignavibacteria bacterium]|nr:primosomal protein N' [Ignavibacteria bacterium]